MDRLLRRRAGLHRHQQRGICPGSDQPSLRRFGKWGAVLVAATIFSAGHVTNVLFEDFTLLEWADKFSATFGFAVLYGALFLRTGSPWPLGLLHMLHDYSCLTSGTLGPFVSEQIDIRLHMILTALNIAYGLAILLMAPSDETPG